MAKVYLIAYSKMNLGDDMFVDMLLKKYGEIEFYSRAIDIDSVVYSDNDNLHFLDYKLDDLLEQDIEEFDAFVYIGGSIFMEKGGKIERVIKLRDLAFKCKNYGIPFYYISSNFGPYQTEEYKEVVAEIFENSTDVCLRDKQSYDLFKHINSVRYAPDLLFSKNIERVDKESKTVGISIIDFKYREELKKYENKYYNVIKKTIKQLITEGYKVKLFSFCKYEGDEEIAKKLILEMNKDKNIELVSYKGNLKKFIREYSKMEYMISSRFHSMVLSYLLQQKMIVLSYSKKINNVIEDLKIIDQYYELKDLQKINKFNVNDFIKPNLKLATINGAKLQLENLNKLLLKGADIEEKVTVIIPAKDEEKTIQKVVKLVQKSSVVSQIIVVDNNSYDNTAINAKLAGAEVIFCKENGKGYAMQEGLKYARNDIIVYIDADISNYSKDLINKLCEPIIYRKVDFVKSMFDRVGGRVTELVAKPMLKILFPNMHEFSQPLSGMIAGRKNVFGNLEFEKDYGVDIGILLDVINLGVSFEEVHVGKIKNVSQKWQALEKMSKEVMTAIIKRANY